MTMTQPVDSKKSAARGARDVQLLLAVAEASRRFITATVPERAARERDLYDALVELDKIRPSGTWAATAGAAGT